MSKIRYIRIYVTHGGEKFAICSTPDVGTGEVFKQDLSEKELFSIMQCGIFAYKFV